MSDDKKAVLTPEHIRTRFNISLSQVYNLMKDREDPLPNYRIGKSYRINEDELEAWLDRHHFCKE